jgi:hypothetical protein
MATVKPLCLHGQSSTPHELDIPASLEFLHFSGSPWSASGSLGNDNFFLQAQCQEEKWQVPLVVLTKQLLSVSRALHHSLPQAHSYHTWLLAACFETLIHIGCSAWNNIFRQPQVTPSQNCQVSTSASLFQKACALTGLSDFTTVHTTAWALFSQFSPHFTGLSVYQDGRASHLSHAAVTPQ